MNRFLLALIASLSLVLVPAAVADAATITKWKVEVTGTARYSLTNTYPADSEEWTADFGYHGVIPEVTFRDSTLVHSALDSTIELTDTRASSYRTSDDGRYWIQCDGNAPGWATAPFYARQATWTGPPGANVDIVLFGEALFPMTCGDSEGNDLKDERLSIGLRPGGSLAAVETVLPPEALASGLIIDKYDRKIWPEPQYCPYAQPGNVTDCRMNLKGETRWTLLSREVEPPPVPEQPDGGGNGTPPPSNNGNPPVATPVLPGKATVASGAKTASFVVSCPAGCRVKAALFADRKARRAGRARAAAAKALVKKTVTVRPGAAKTKVVLKLGSSARRAVKKAGGLRIEIKATPTAGAGATVTKTIRARAPAR